MDNPPSKPSNVLAFGPPKKPIIGGKRALPGELIAVIRDAQYNSTETIQKAKAEKEKILLEIAKLQNLQEVGTSREGSGATADALYLEFLNKRLEAENKKIPDTGPKLITQPHGDASAKPQETPILSVAAVVPPPTQKITTKAVPPTMFPHENIGDVPKMFADGNPETPLEGQETVEDVDPVIEGIKKQIAEVTKKYPKIFSVSGGTTDEKTSETEMPPQTEVKESIPPEINPEEITEFFRKMSEEIVERAKPLHIPEELGLVKVWWNKSSPASTIPLKSPAWALLLATIISLGGDANKSPEHQDGVPEEPIEIRAVIEPTPRFAQKNNPFFNNIQKNPQHAKQTPPFVAKNPQPIFAKLPTPTKESSSFAWDNGIPPLDIADTTRFAPVNLAVNTSKQSAPQTFSLNNAPAHDSNAFSLPPEIAPTMTWGTPAKIPEPKIPRAETPPDILKRATQALANDVATLFNSGGFFDGKGVNSPHWKDPRDGFGIKTVDEIVNAKIFPSLSEGGQQFFGIKSEEATHKLREYLKNVMKVSGVTATPGENAAKYVIRAAAAMLTK